MADIKADITTTAQIIPGTPFHDRLDQAGDRDWVKITLAKGERLEVDLQGDTNGDSLSDPYLRIYDTNGQYITGDDDSGGDLNARIGLNVARSGTYFIEAAAFDDASMGNYILTAQISEVTAKPSPKLPAGPLRALDWGMQLQDNVVSVYFVPSGKSRDGYTSEGFNSYERAQFAEVFAAIAAVSGLQFNITRDPTADLQLVLDTNEIGPDFYGYFNPPGEYGSGIGVFNGTLWDRSRGGDLEPGGNGYATIVHEVLHGLGLAHPHDPGGTSRVMAGVSAAFGDYGRADLNQGVYTVMSYNNGHNTGAKQQQASDDMGHAAGPMALDIAVLQAFYGKNETTHAGNNSYLLPDVANRGDMAWQSIWDTGGLDKIYYNGTQDTVIDLRAATLVQEQGGGGYISAADLSAGGFTIAKGVQIEDAVGGYGDDTLRGNALDNMLNGRNGQDILFGGNGDDVLHGGNGADRMNGGAGDDRLLGGNHIDVLRGESGDDILFGAQGADLMMGSRGADLLYGGQGKDRLMGGAGADVLTGGSEADVFIIEAMRDSVAGRATRDVITDFRAGVDVLDFERLDADATRGGNQRLEFMRHDRFDDSGQLRVAHSAKDTFVMVDTDGDGTSDIAIMLRGVIALTADSFVF